MSVKIKDLDIYYLIEYYGGHKKYEWYNMHRECTLVVERTERNYSFIGKTNEKSHKKGIFVILEIGQVNVISFIFN